MDIEHANKMYFNYKGQKPDSYLAKYKEKREKILSDNNGPEPYQANNLIKFCLHNERAIEGFLGKLDDFQLLKEIIVSIYPLYIKKHSLERSVDIILKKNWKDEEKMGLLLDIALKHGQSINLNGYRRVDPEYGASYLSKILYRNGRGDLLKIMADLLPSNIVLKEKDPLNVWSHSITKLFNAYKKHQAINFLTANNDNFLFVCIRKNNLAAAEKLIDQGWDIGIQNAYNQEVFKINCNSYDSRKKSPELMRGLEKYSMDKIVEKKRESFTKKKSKMTL